MSWIFLACLVLYLFGKCVNIDAMDVFISSRS